jgi:hypothetical protein
MGWTILGTRIPSATLRGLRPLVSLRGLRPLASLRGLRGNLLSDGLRTFTYECAASLKRSERDKLYRLTGAEYSTGEEFSYAYDPVGNPVFATPRGTNPVSACASWGRLSHCPHPHPDRHDRHHLRLRCGQPACQRGWGGLYLGRQSPPLRCEDFAPSFHFGDFVTSC